MANNCKIPCKLWIFAMLNAIISWTCGNYCSNQMKKIGGLQAIWYLPWGAIVNAISQYACTEPLKSFSISPGRLWGWYLRGRSWVTQQCWSYPIFRRRIYNPPTISQKTVHVSNSFLPNFNGSSKHLRAFTLFLLVLRSPQGHARAQN